jgi:hypothetical protein
MALSYPLAFPSVGITNFSLRLIRAVAISQSPFTFDQQVHDFGGARWEAEVTLPPLTYAEAKAVEAFILSLKGQYGTFTLGHPLHNTVVDGDPIQVATGGSKGDTLIQLKGGAAAAGSYFSLDGQLYVILEDKSTGTSVIQTDPPLRGSVSVDDTLDFTLPTGKWRMASNDVGWSTDASGLNSFSFACVEAY